MIRRLLLLACLMGLGLPLSAQSLLTVGVGKGNVSAGGGGGGTGIGPVDFFTDFTGASAGSDITTGILNTGTHGNSNHGGWGVTGTAPVGMQTAAHGTNCGLLGSVSVDGTTYATSNTSLAMTMDNTQTLRFVSAATPSIGYTQAVVTFCFTPNMTGIGGSGVFDILRVDQSDGNAQIIQISQTNCLGTLGFDLETVVPATNATTCISATNGTSYWLCLLTDIIGGTAKLAVFSSTGTQIGSTLTLAQATTSTISAIKFGEIQTGTAAGANTFENWSVRFSGSVPFPLGPASTTQSPVYWIAKSLVNNAASGTALQTTKTIDVPAGATILVATFSENASMTVTAPTDIGSTNTFTHCVACDVTLAANGRGEIWYVTNATVKAADQFTCNTNASTFRNCAAVVLSASVFDTGAVGTTSAGSADVTTASFTPSLNATCTMFGYITAGQAFTAGTNYFIGNTSATTSFAFQQRASVANSAQTATLKQANTSSKWASLLCAK